MSGGGMGETGAVPANLFHFCITIITNIHELNQPTNQRSPPINAPTTPTPTPTLTQVYSRSRSYRSRHKVLPKPFVLYSMHAVRTSSCYPFAFLRTCARCAIARSLSSPSFSLPLSVSFEKKPENPQKRVWRNHYPV